MHYPQKNKAMGVKIYSPNLILFVGILKYCKLAIRILRVFPAVYIDTHNNRILYLKQNFYIFVIILS